MRGDILGREVQVGPIHDGVTVHVHDGVTVHARPLLSVSDVAVHLNVSEALVYELAKKGQIPCGKIGRIYRFEWDEVLAWWNIRKGGRRA